MAKSNRDEHTQEYWNHLINKEMEGAFQVVEFELF